MWAKLLSWRQLQKMHNWLSVTYYSIGFPIDPHEQIAISLISYQDWSLQLFLWKDFTVFYDVERHKSRWVAPCVLHRVTLMSQMTLIQLESSMIVKYINLRRMEVNFWLLVGSFLPIIRLKEIPFDAEAKRISDDMRVSLMLLILPMSERMHVLSTFSSRYTTDWKWKLFKSKLEADFYSRD